LRIAVWGGAGGGIGRVVWESTFEKDGLLDWGGTQWLGFFLAGVAVLFWETRVDPALEARLSGASAVPEKPARRGLKHTLIATLQAFVAVFIVQMFFELLDAPLRQDPVAFFRSVLTIAIICGAITYAWVRCAQRSLLWAMLSGFLAGFAVSYLATVVDVCIWPSAYRIPRDRLFEVLLAWRFHLQYALNALTWGSWGLAGGLAIQRKWGPCASMGILIAALVLDPLWTIALWGWFGERFMQRLTFALMFLGAFRTLGWGLGLFICPGADRLLDLSPITRSRRGMIVFWGLGGAALLLYTVVAAAKFWIGQPTQ
jgi:hypothetical protein